MKRELLRSLMLHDSYFLVKLYFKEICDSRVLKGNSIEQIHILTTWQTNHDDKDFVGKSELSLIFHIFD